MAQETRREFLERTAYTAGMAGLAAALPAGTILAEAADAAARRSGLPSPRNLPIDHFVVLMMENRSFDHYFGWVPGADAIQDQSYTDPSGASVPTRHFSTLGSGGMEYKGCGHPDPGHGWESGRAQLLGGFLADGSGNDEFALTYFNRGELGFIHEAARNYTLYDRFFCSLLASTWPNRYYKWSGSIGWAQEQRPAGRDGRQPVGDDLRPRPGARPQRALLRLRPALLRGLGSARRHLDQPDHALLRRLRGRTLPNISFVDPPFRDGGGGDGLSADEHPLGDVRLGQAFMADVVNAFVKSPCYRRGALFVLYDEWGGFFDHVTPAPRGRRPRERKPVRGLRSDGLPDPRAAVSPYARGRRQSSGFRVDHGLYGHESVLKLISYRFGLGDLTLRQAQSRNIGLSFDWDQADFDTPALPDPPEVATAPCALGGGDVLDSQAAHAGDLVALEQLADRFGVPSYEGKLGDIFTLPDSIQRAVLART